MWFVRLEAFRALSLNNYSPPSFPTPAEGRAKVLKAMDTINSFFSSFQPPTYNHGKAKTLVTLTRNRVKIQVHTDHRHERMNPQPNQREKNTSLHDLAEKDIAEVLTPTHSLTSSLIAPAPEGW